MGPAMIDQCCSKRKYSNPLRDTSEPSSVAIVPSCEPSAQHSAQVHVRPSSPPRPLRENKSFSFSCNKKEGRIGT